MANRIAELEIAKHQRDLILKPHEAHIIGMPMTVAPIEKITTTGGGLAELPVGAYDFGLIDKEAAITMSRTFERSDINAIGYSNPVRSDITSELFGFNFTGLETNRYTIEANLGVDLAAHVPDVNGEVAFDSPAVPTIRRQRYLLLSRINSGVDTIYFGRYFYAGEVAEVGEQTVTDGEGYLGWPMTVNANVDTEFGVSVRHFFGGPGWDALLEEAGFQPKAVTP